MAFIGISFPAKMIGGDVPIYVKISERPIWISGDQRSGYRPLSSDRCIGGASAPVRETDKNYAITMQ